MTIYDIGLLKKGNWVVTANGAVGRIVLPLTFQVTYYKNGNWYVTSKYDNYEEAMKKQDELQLILEHKTVKVRYCNPVIFINGDSRNRFQFSYKNLKVINKVGIKIQNVEPLLEFNNVDTSNIVVHTLKLIESNVPFHLVSLN